MARAFSGPEMDQIAMPCTSAVDALGSLMSGEPYELFQADYTPVERGSFRCRPLVDPPWQWVIDNGDGDLVDHEGRIVGGISYGYSNEDGGRFWLLKRVAVLGAAWRCEYRYLV